MSPYFAAFYLELQGESSGRRSGRPRPPAAGKPPSLPFYKALLDEYDDLIKKQHHPSPLKEIARRRGVKVGTVKSWRSRGLKYLKGERS